MSEKWAARQQENWDVPAVLRGCKIYLCRLSMHLRWLEGDAEGLIQPPLDQQLFTCNTTFPRKFVYTRILNKKACAPVLPLHPLPLNFAKRRAPLTLQLKEVSLPYFLVHRCAWWCQNAAASTVIEYQVATKWESDSNIPDFTGFLDPMSMKRLFVFI